MGGAWPPSPQPQPWQQPQQPQPWHQPQPQLQPWQLPQAQPLPAQPWQQAAPGPRHVPGGAKPGWQRDWLVALICGPLVFGLLGLLWINPSRPSPWADEWDPRVTDLVEFIEEERGLEFTHPVVVNFLTEDEMRAELTASVETSNEEDPQPAPGEDDPYLGYLRAMGLIEGDLDLQETADSIITELAVAFYSPRTSQVYVVYGDGGLLERSVLVHELTHALQDQAFDLEREFDDYRAKSQLRFLTEGDARRIEQAYVDSHSEAEIAEYDMEQRAESDAAYEGREDPTPAITATFVSQYEMGWAATRYLVAADGQEALDELFRHPSTNALLEFDFVRYDLSDGTAGRDPASAPQPDGQEIFTDSLGPMGLFLLLSENGSAERALVDAYQWNGDTVTVSESNASHVICANAAVDMGSAEAAQALAADLEPWRAAVAAAARTVKVDGTTVLFGGCDPGPVDQPLKGVSLEAIVLPIQVNLATANLVEEGFAPRVARCAAFKTVQGFGLEGLTGGTVTSDQYWAALETHLDSCPI